MKNVKELRIVFGDYVSRFIVTEGGWYHSDEIFPDMKESLNREKSDVLKLFTERGYVKETDSIDIIDWIIVIEKKDEGISIEEGVEIIHLLEKEYEVVSFEFETEFDGFSEEAPNLTICVRDK